METSPEFKLLLACTRNSVMISGSADSPALPCEGVDWEKLYRTTCWHRLRPLLRSALLRSEATAIPDWFRERLDEDARRISHRNVLRTGELVRLLQLFGAEELPVIVLKGPTLALKVYGEINAREFQDLDLLVRQADYARAEELLLRRYAQVPIAISADRHRTENYESNFTHAESGTKVDLHWRLHLERESYRIDYERYFESPHRQRFFGQSIRDLSAEEWVLLLSIHAARHRYNRLHWLVDLAAFIVRNSDIDWAGTLQEATRAHAQRCLLLTMLLLQDFWELPVPECLHKAAEADLHVRSVSGSVSRRLRSGECETFQDFSDACLWAMNLQDHWSGRMKYGYWIGKGATRRLVRTLRRVPHS